MKRPNPSFPPYEDEPTINYSWHFDCWDRSGEIQCITIEALNASNATIIFKHKHPNLAFDEPYQ